MKRKRLAAFQVTCALSRLPFFLYKELCACGGSFLKLPGFDINLRQEICWNMPIVPGNVTSAY